VFFLVSLEHRPVFVHILSCHVRECGTIETCLSERS
jgi:hypothetical protein